MNIKMMESYLDNIAEQVVDEDKIVTYKSLSRSLGIHVNTSKQLLYIYLTKEKSKNAFPVSATYLIGGKTVDGSFNITIVNEADLKDARETFIEVTSEHVYSVQKGKNLKDLKVLNGVNKEQASLDNPKLVIACSRAELISTGEVKKKTESYEESNKKAIKDAFLPEKPPVNMPKPVETKEKTEPLTNKESKSKSPKKTSPKGNQPKAQDAVKKSTGNIANMFAKAAQKNTTKSATSAKSDKNPSKEQTEPQVIDTITTKNVEPEKTEKQGSGRSKSTESLRRKKKGNKRKRIQMLSDSEDEDSNDGDEEEEEPRVDIEEDEDNNPSTIDLEEEKEFIPKNKRKKRKVIDRTVMNEDGYLETKKEVVFETDSENEPEEPPAANEKKEKTEPPIKRSGVQSTAKKQSSLLTFFKKS